MSVTLNQLARAMSRAASRSEAAHAEMAGAAVAWGFGFSVGSDPPEGPAGSSSAGRAAPGITTAPHFGQQRSPE